MGCLTGVTTNKITENNPEIFAFYSSYSPITIPIPVSDSTASSSAIHLLSRDLSELR